MKTVKLEKRESTKNICFHGDDQLPRSVLFHTKLFHVRRFHVESDDSTDNEGF